MANKQVRLTESDIRRLVSETVNRMVNNCITESEDGFKTLCFVKDENGTEAYNSLLRDLYKDKDNPGWIKPDVYTEEFDDHYCVTVMKNEPQFINVWKYLMRHGVNFLKQEN